MLDNSGARNPIFRAIWRRNTSRSCMAAFMSRTPGPWRRSSGNREHRCSPGISGAQWSSKQGIGKRKTSHPAEAEIRSYLSIWPPNGPVSEQNHIHIRHCQWGNGRGEGMDTDLPLSPKGSGSGWIKPPMVSSQPSIHLSSLRTEPSHIERWPRQPYFIPETPSLAKLIRPEGYN